MEWGNLSTDLSNPLPKIRWVIVEGRLSTGWLKNEPKVRWVTDGGSEVISSSK